MKAIGKYKKASWDFMHNMRTVTSVFIGGGKPSIQIKLRPLKTHTP